MKKRFVSLLCALALCLGLLPATALAEDTAPQTLYVGNYQIKSISGDTLTYLKAGPTEGSLIEGTSTDWTVRYEPSIATLTATVEPSDATNQNVTWASSNSDVATVTAGADNTATVTAKSAGVADITATVNAEGGNKTPTCHVTVTPSTYGLSADPAALNFGSAYIGYARPAARTVTVTNTGSRPLTLTQPASTAGFEVGTLSKAVLAAGETASFTVQPRAGLAAGTYRENITVSGSEGASATISAAFNVMWYSITPPPTPAAGRPWTG